MMRRVLNRHPKFQPAAAMRGKARLPPLYPPPRVVAIDVDGTLIREDGTLNQGVVTYCRNRRSEGFRMMLWSSRGLAHARATAEAHGIPDLFDDIVSKPGHVVDDRGWGWTQYTKVHHPDRLPE